MSQCAHASSVNGPDYDRTLILAVEISRRSWVVAAQVPGAPQKGAKRQLAPRAEALMAAIEGYKRRATTAGMTVDRVIVAYESGGDGFWLARWLQQRAIEVHLMQPSSVPVDRRMRRAKSDRIDVDMLLRTLLAWLRGEPRVCSMVPVPDEATEDARRPIREREELIRARIALVNRIEAVLTVLGAGEYNPLRRDCREQLGQLRTGLGQPLPPHARAQIERLLDRLDLVRKQIADLEAERDRVVEGQAAGPAERMIRQLVRLRGIGVQTATVLVHEAFVRSFRNARALGSYAGLSGTPYSSGGTRREQGISKDGNRRLRAALVELAWMWLRYQPGCALSRWFHDRLGGSRGRLRKVMVVALARKLLVALWRYLQNGVVPQGMELKPTAA
jgi:transposase